MKISFAIAVAILAFTACTNKANNDGKQAAENLNKYIDSVNTLNPNYTVETWSVMDSGYQARALNAEKSMEQMIEEDKVKTKESKEKYEKLKAAYEAKLKANETAAANPTKVGTTAPTTTKATVPDNRQSLRNRLFGEGKIGSDMKFDYVKGSNILAVYKSFVNTVADNKKEYTREDWDEINVLYEALDNRKNAVEKDLPISDNMKIASLKVRFASIMATNRGGAKVKENEESKL